MSLLLYNFTSNIQSIMENQQKPHRIKLFIITEKKSGGTE